MIIIVYGEPAPQGSKKFVGIAKSTGRGILVESSKKVKPWRQDVKAAALDAIKERSTFVTFDEPLYVWMTFYLPKPASNPKTRKTYPMRKPDLSKLVRSTEDALTDAGIWRDDSRVIRLVATKCYVGEAPEPIGGLDDASQVTLNAPGCVIRIMTL